LDLNGFKGVNDSLGHQAGDVLLDQVAQRLRGLVRDTDTVARLGGDEFAILVAGEPVVAEVLVTRIHERLGQPVQVYDQSVQVGVSVGIALSPKHTDNASTLLRCADTAMYHAKRQRSGPQLYTADGPRVA